MKVDGRIYSYFADRSYGFLFNTDVNGNNITHFFHANNFTVGTPGIGKAVRFIAVPGRKGPVAVEIEVIEGGAK